MGILGVCTAAHMHVSRQEGTRLVRGCRVRDGHISPTEEAKSVVRDKVVDLTGGKSILGRLGMLSTPVLLSHMWILDNTNVETITSEMRVMTTFKLYQRPR